MSEVPEWAKQFMPLDAATKAAEIRMHEELKQATAKISELQHADCNKRIATLTAERDSAKRELAELQADATVERTKYEALKLERDTERGLRLASEQENDRLRTEREGIKQQLADSELAFAHANEVVGKLESEVARLSAPVTDAEWLDLCSGDHVQFADLQRHEVDRFIAARTSPAKETHDWVCETCHARYAEYVNGCPKCWANGEKRSGVRHQPASK